MRQRKVAWTLLGTLMLVFVAINLPIVWKWMYPIKYQQEILQAAKRYSLDPHLLVAIIRTESDFKPDRISKKGATGLMQLMPETADWIAAQPGLARMDTKDLTHPNVNIELGGWYLAYLLKKFDNNPVPAIAAYNAGPTKVNQWLAENIWDGRKETIQDIPFGETRHYVQRVLYYHQRYDQVYDEQLE